MQKADGPRDDAKGSAIRLVGWAFALPALVGAGLLAAALLSHLMAGDVTMRSWVQGPQDGISRLLDDVGEEFPQLRRRPSRSEHKRPETCSNDAVALEWSGLTDLESIRLGAFVSDAHAKHGLQACLGTTFSTHGGSAVDGQRAGNSGISIMAPGLQALFVLFVAGIYRRKGRELGILQPPKDRHWAAVLGVVAVAALLLLLARELAIEVVAEEGSGFGHPMSWHGKGGLVLLAALVSAGFLQPYVEELVFRAWMIPLLERATNPWAAVAISTVFFSLLHVPVTGADWFVYICAGLVFSSVWLLTRSLLVCVALHSLWNLANALLAVSAQSSGQLMPW